MKAYKFIIASLLTLGMTACSSDYLDVDYTQELDAEAAAEAASHQPDAFLNSMWTHMVDMYSSSHDTFNFMSVLHATDLMTEDIAYQGDTWFIYDYDLDDRMWDYRRTYVNWTTFYNGITKANEVIGGFPDGVAETEESKALLGQAKAFRGMCYDYLIQLFRPYVKADGTIDRDSKGLPLILTEADGFSTSELAELKGVNTVGAVIDQAGKDLEAAVKLLSGANYVRPNKDYIDLNVAQGLLARHYLFTQQWAKAEAAAHAARQGYAPMGNAELHDGFITASNPEWMWGFIHSSETTTVYASFFSHISNIAPGYAGVGYKTICIDARLYSQIPNDDYRKSLFNGPAGDKSQANSSAQAPYANLKFGDDGQWTMDYMYMRAAEMYLIEAEAMIRQGNAAGAGTVMAELMAQRQPSWDVPSPTLSQVQLQRRIELWGEGFSYFDLKRNFKGIDRDYEGSNHQDGYRKVIPADTTCWTYQIPQREIQENDLISESDQNP